MLERTGRFVSGAYERWRQARATDKAFLVAGLALVTVLAAFVVLAVRGSLGLLIVQTASMAPEMPPGSLVVFTAAQIEDVYTGQLVVFKEDPSSKAVITHRAVGSFYEDGRLYIATKGDNNPRQDSRPVGREQLMGVGVWVIPHMGRALASAKTPAGMFALNFALALFLLLLVIERVRTAERARFSRALAEYGATDALAADLVRVPGAAGAKRLESS